ncbi:MAG: DUF3667 domain-containing protein [Ginsengibacter sp.]
MAHLPERKEKNCLNCGATVVGRYCHSCGQENIEPKETVWHFVSHFINDITHFDGKFFTTLKDLIFKPGFLSKQYVKGKRVSYLNPIRMYLFTSFIFFLVFFSVVRFGENFESSFTYFGKTRAQVDTMSVVTFSNFTSKINKGIPMTRTQYYKLVDSLKQDGGIYFTKHKYKSKHEYDSLLKVGARKDNWLNRKLVYRGLDMNKRYGNDSGKILRSVFTSFMHHFPQMLFVSLPLVTMLLQLLYIRHKEYFYVSHAIFIIHYYVFIFIAMMAGIGVSEMQDTLGWSWLGYLNLGVSLAVLWYLYKAMRNFYGQSRWKTISKYFLFLFMALIIIILLMAGFFIFSIFQS